MPDEPEQRRPVLGQASSGTARDTQRMEPACKEMQQVARARKPTVDFSPRPCQRHISAALRQLERAADSQAARDRSPRHERQVNYDLGFWRVRTTPETLGE